MSLRYYLGPWLWNAGPELFWSGPVGSVGCVDLANLSQQAASVDPAQRGIGFFAVDGIIADSAYSLVGVGDLRDQKVNAGIKSTWKSVTSYRADGDALIDLLWDHLCGGADPDGSSACKPLVPGIDGWMDLHLGGHGRIRGERFEWGRPGSRGTDHTAKLRQLLRADFRAIFNAVQDGKARANQHRRVLQMMVEKYPGADWRDLVPPDLLPNVPGPLPHETTITDNFNRANGAIGSSAEGWSWNALTGSWNVASNTAEGQTVSGSSSALRADSDLSSSDHYSQGDITQCGSGSGSADSLGAMCRKDSTATLTFYVARIARQASDLAQLFKFVSGAATQLGSDSSITISLPQQIKTTCNGTSIKCTFAGTDKITQTDTAISTGVRCGFRTFIDSATKPRVDNFQAADLASSTILFTQLERSVRGLNRGTYAKW